MSKKVNRLRRRMEIEAARVRKVEHELAAERLRLETWERGLAVRQARIEIEQRDLNRSVALRMRVERDFTQPIGNAFGLNLVLYPEEYRHAWRYSGQNAMRDLTYYAAEKGREAGQQIAEVILRCLKGEMEDFTKAR